MNDEMVPLSVEPSATNHFAWARTAMALQRTHFGTVRTAAALTGVAAFIYIAVRPLVRRACAAFTRRLGFRPRPWPPAGRLAEFELGMELPGELLHQVQAVRDVARIDRSPSHAVVGDLQAELPPPLAAQAHSDVSA